MKALASIRTPGHSGKVTCTEYGKAEHLGNENRELSGKESST